MVSGLSCRPLHSSAQAMYQAFAPLTFAPVQLAKASVKAQPYISVGGAYTGTWRAGDAAPLELLLQRSTLTQQVSVLWSSCQVCKS